MARTRKIGLEYFPLDIDMFQDIRIRKLIKRKGCKAVSIYTLMLCMIYKNGYYLLWDEDLPFIISEQTGFDEDYIKDAFGCCVELGLFDEELFRKHKAITSKGIQTRYKLICTQLKRKADIEEYLLISSEDKGINSEKTPISSEDKGINSEKTPISSEEKPINSVKMQQKKIKENKSKEKEIKEEREREKKEREADASSPSPTPPPSEGLSFEKFSEWLCLNAPELLDLKPPSPRTWTQVKILYQTPLRLAKACEEIAANPSFMKKWRYFSVALTKWHEQGERLGIKQ